MTLEEIVSRLEKVEAELIRLRGEYNDDTHPLFIHTPIAWDIDELAVDVRRATLKVEELIKS